MAGFLSAWNLTNRQAKAATPVSLAGRGYCDACFGWVVLRLSSLHLYVLLDDLHNATRVRLCLLLFSGTNAR